MTCEDGYGGRAGGRDWLILGGSGGAGLGAGLGGSVEFFLKVPEWFEKFAAIVELLDGVF